MVKKTYKYCFKNLKENKKKRIEEEKLEEKLKVNKEKEIKKWCKKEYKKNNWKLQVEHERQARSEYKALPMEEQLSYEYYFITFYKQKYGRRSVMYGNRSYQKYKENGCHLDYWD